MGHNFSEVIYSHLCGRPAEFQAGVEPLGGYNAASQTWLFCSIAVRLISVKNNVPNPREPSMKIYVGNVSREVTEEDLQQAFEACCAREIH